MGDVGHLIHLFAPWVKGALASADGLLLETCRLCRAWGSPAQMWGRRLEGAGAGRDNDAERLVGPVLGPGFTPLLH